MQALHCKVMTVQVFDCKLNEFDRPNPKIKLMPIRKTKENYKIKDQRSGPSETAASHLKLQRLVYQRVEGVPEQT